jgi:hypothetical protein
MSLDYLVLVLKNIYIYIYIYISHLVTVYVLVESHNLT